MVVKEEALVKSVITHHFSDVIRKDTPPGIISVICSNKKEMRNVHAKVTK